MANYTNLVMGVARVSFPRVSFPRLAQPHCLPQGRGEGEQLVGISHLSFRTASDRVSHHIIINKLTLCHKIKGSLGLKAN